MAFKDINFHGIKARKIGSYVSEIGGQGFSLKFIDGAVWFAHGSFRKDPEGRKFAQKGAAKMRRAGYKARVVEYANEIQVFCNKRAGAHL